MNAPGQKILKVTGILYVVFVGIVLTIVFAGMDDASIGSALEANSKFPLWFMLLYSLFELYMGIVGIVYCRTPEKAGLLVNLAKADLILFFISLKVDFQWISLIDIPLPVLYIIGAIKNQNAYKAANAKPNENEYKIANARPNVQPSGAGQAAPRVRPTQVMVVFCWNCGRLVSVSANKCGCGAPRAGDQALYALRELSAQANARPPVLAQNEAVISCCQNCGRPVIASSVQCAGCGMPRDQGQKLYVLQKQLICQTTKAI